MKIIQTWADFADVAQPIPLYLLSADVDGCNGFGEVVFTNNPMAAKQFKDSADAVLYYTRVSKVRPTRPDGEPNRPLRTFTISIIDKPTKL